MKVISKRLLAPALLLFNAYVSFAGGPGVPGDEDCDGLPCQGDVPIDQNIFIFIAIALLLGVYIIYKNLHIKEKL
jgi:hypothetical protein